MPSGQYVALGAVADAIGNEFAKRRDQAHAEEVKNQDLIKNLVTAGMQSGQISNPQQAFEWMVQQYGGSKGKGGKAGKGGSGGGLPQPLQTLIGAIQQGSQQVGSGSPSGQPSGELPKFSSPAELAQTEDKRKVQLATDTATATGKASYEEKVREAADLRAKNPTLSLRESLEAVGMKLPSQAPKYTPGSVVGASLPPNATDIYGQPVDPKKYYRQGTDSEGTASFVPTEAPAGQQTKEGSIGEFFKTREQELGHKLTTTEQAKARRDYMSGLTPEQKLQQQRSIATFRYELGAPKADDIADQAQSITLGGKDVPFTTLDNFSGQAAKNAAREQAKKAGVAVVTKQQADQLAAANTAIGNLNEFFDTIKGKLPADAASRPIAQVEIPLKQLFQTDEDLAAAVAWNITVLPQLRAMAVTGRVPVFEYQQALAAQPKLTDTVGTAAKKLKIVQGVLERGAHSVLDRGGKPAGGPSNSVPKDVTDALKDKPNGHKYRVGGIIYDKAADGSVAPSQP